MKLSKIGDTYHPGLAEILSTDKDITYRSG